MTKKRYIGHDRVETTKSGHVYVPDDYPALSPWHPFVRCLRSAARSRGVSIVSIKVVVDESGSPLFWLEPQQTLVQPLSATDDILKLLTDND